MKSRTKKILKIMGLSLLSLTVFVGIYRAFATQGIFKKQRGWTCRNYQLVCLNLSSGTAHDTLTLKQLNKVFSSRHKSVKNDNQKDVKE